MEDKPLNGFCNLEFIWNLDLVIWDLIIFQFPYYFPDAPASLPDQVLINAFCDPYRRQGINEGSGTHLDSRGTGEHEFNCIGGIHDPADPDDGKA